MYSKSQATRLLSESGYKFDYAIYLRPDVTYVNDFQMNFLSISCKKSVVIPNFALSGGFNDRFAIMTSKNYQKYGDIFPKLLDYSKKKPLHSERIQIRILKKDYRLSIKMIPFFFNRTRCNGYTKKDFDIRHMNTLLQEWRNKFPDVPKTNQEEENPNDS
jgi:hypothetical protein